MCIKSGCLSVFKQVANCIGRSCFVLFAVVPLEAENCIIFGCILFQNGVFEIHGFHCRPARNAGLRWANGATCIACFKSSCSCVCLLLCF